MKDRTWACPSERASCGRSLGVVEGDEMITMKDCAVLATASYARSTSEGSAEKGLSAIRMMTAASPRWMTVWSHDRGHFNVALYRRDIQNSPEYVMSFRGSDTLGDWFQNIGGFGLAKLNKSANVGRYVSYVISVLRNRCLPATLAWIARQKIQELCDTQARNTRAVAGHMIKEATRLNYPCRIATVGHSLGGGLAKIAAVELVRGLESHSVATFVGCAAFNSPYIEDGYPDLQHAGNNIINVNSRNDFISKYSRWKANSIESQNTVLVDTRILALDVDNQLSKSIESTDEVTRRLLMWLSQGRRDVAQELAKALRAHASDWASLVAQVVILGPHCMMHLIEALGSAPYSTVPFYNIKAKSDSVDFSALGGR